MTRILGFVAMETTEGAVLLHRVDSKIYPGCPFVVRGGRYLVGTCGSKTRLVHISHDSTLPLTVEIFWAPKVLIWG